MALTRQYGAKRYDLTAATTTTGGAVLSAANPEGETVIVTRATLYTSTKSTGAANLDIGIAAGASTSSDTLLDGVDVGTAAGVFDNIDDQGTNGQSCLTWGSGEYLTVTASASVAGIAGYLYVEYYRTT